MMRFYGRVLDSKIKDVVDEFLNQAPVEQTNVLEELALIRVDAARYVALYDAAVRSGNAELIDSAGQVMRDALKEVVKVAKDAADIEAKSTPITPMVVATIITQYSAAIAQFVDEDTCELIQQYAKDRIKVPGLSPSGTELTPEDVTLDAVEMDGSIPDA